MGNFRSGVFSRDGGRNDRRGSNNRFGGERRSFGGGNRGFSRDGGRDRPQMHQVTCAKCGKQCEVPFKPRGDKPVLCSDCFRKNDSRGNGFSKSSNGAGISQDQFKQINDKLDKILAALEDFASEEDLDEEFEEDISEEELAK